jgi:hypothetical protein
MCAQGTLHIQCKPAAAAAGRTSACLCTFYRSKFGVEAFTAVCCVSVSFTACRRCTCGSEGHCCSFCGRCSDCTAARVHRSLCTAVLQAGYCSPCSGAGVLHAVRAVLQGVLPMTSAAAHVTHSVALQPMCCSPCVAGCARCSACCSLCTACCSMCTACCVLQRPYRSPMFCSLRTAVLQVLRQMYLLCSCVCRRLRWGAGYRCSRGLMGRAYETLAAATRPWELHGSLPG